MENFLNVLGGISNAIAAVSAVVAIVVTVKYYNKDKDEQKKERISEKKAALYKESIIDTWLNKMTGDISNINKEIMLLSQRSTFSLDALQELYNRIRLDSKMWLYEMEIIKVFNEKLYEENKNEVEKIIDTYSEIIITSIKNGYIEKDFTVKINKRQVFIRRRLYKKYLKLV